MGMSREEAKSFKNGCIIPVTQNGIQELMQDFREHIDNIYNDFESRICENCKYAEEMNKGSSFMSCSKNIRKSLYMQHNSKDFGCNKWEKI